jgi:hypothetical protein
MEGHAKLEFFNSFNPEPGNAYSLADWLTPRPIKSAV